MPLSGPWFPKQHAEYWTENPAFNPHDKDGLDPRAAAEIEDIFYSDRRRRTRRPQEKWARAASRARPETSSTWEPWLIRRGRSDGAQAPAGTGWSPRVKLPPVAGGCVKGTEKSILPRGSGQAMPAPVSLVTRDRVFTESAGPDQEGYDSDGQPEE